MLGSSEFSIELHTVDASGSPDKNLGPLYWYPELYAPVWNSYLDTWFGRLASGNGSYAEPGKYTFLVRALRIFGERDKGEDWDEARTVEFKFVYA